ncbi:uncharacterized protein [Salvelinus alpinus]|uniref:uncharacterized protein n=1 Tax=Salvelinus alpinus TaxID=8036 RepID=UPI0039FDC412
MVIPIAFYLIRSETYSEIRAARTRQDQMRLLYQALDKDKLKSDFYRILLDLEPDLVIDLGALFVDDHKYQLIQMVTKVKPILYELFYEELYCDIRIHQMTSQEQMRLLYKALEEAEDTRRVKSDFYRILLHLEPGLVFYLDSQELYFYELIQNLSRRMLEEVTKERDSDEEELYFYELQNLSEEVTIERDRLQGDLKELRTENDGLKELRRAKETIQSLSTSPGGQQETQTPSQKRIEGMEMKSLQGGKSAPGSGRKSAPEEESLLAAGPQNDDLDEMERGGRV